MGLLLILWFVSILVFIVGAVKGITRIRMRISTESLSRMVQVISFCLLFMGSGLIIMTMESNIRVLCSFGFEIYSEQHSVQPLDVMYLILRCLADGLRVLAINAFLTGIGFVMALLLMGTRGHPVNSESVENGAKGHP